MYYFFYTKSKFHIVRTKVESITVDVYESQKEIVIWKNRIENHDRRYFYYSYEY